MEDRLPKDVGRNDEIIESVLREFGDISDGRTLINNTMNLILDTFGYEIACVIIFQVRDDNEETPLKFFYYGKHTDDREKVEQVRDGIMGASLVVPPIQIRERVIGKVIEDSVELGRNFSIAGGCTIPLVLSGDLVANFFLLDSQSTEGFNERDKQLLINGLHPLCSLAGLLVEHVIFPEESEGELRRSIQQRILPLVLPIYEKRRYQEKIARLQERFVDTMIIGESMRDVKRDIIRASENDSVKVLIRGETGSGKELVARAIHRLSSRSKGPFVPENCASLPDTLLESELFGHVKGTFTGATENKEGLFERADGGTLFLDEIGDLPLDTQVRLLRVLENNTFRRLGDKRLIKVDVRLITATNVDLEAAVESGKFRKDLYYRIDVFTIDLPPLRERGSDVLLLAYHFLEKSRGERRIVGFSPEAEDLLLKYRWPGNVRELENLVQRVVISISGDVITPHYLLPSMRFGLEKDHQLEDEIDSLKKGLNKRQLKVLRHMKEAGKTEITRSEYEAQVQTTHDTANRDLRALLGESVIEKIGRARATRYPLTEKGHKLLHSI